MALPLSVASCFANRPPAAPHCAQVKIDKIVVLGCPGGCHGWGAELLEGPAPALSGQAQQGTALDAAAGPLWHRPGLPEVALVIRKPGLALGADWTIRITGPAQHAQQ